MTWLVPKLDHRVKILKPLQTPNEFGGADLDFGVVYNPPYYELKGTLATVWMSFNPVSRISGGSKYVRGSQTEDKNVTHVFNCRTTAVGHMGREFGHSFFMSFNSIPDLNPIKTDYFLFVESSNNLKGRLFRIREVINEKEKKEFFKIEATETDERGVGWPI